MAWVLFRCNNLSDSILYYKALFGLNDLTTNSINIKMFLNNETYIAFVFAILGSTTFFISLYKKMKAVTNTFSEKLRSDISFIYDVLQSTTLIILLFICSLYLLANTYNPFIYFRF